MFGWVKAKPPVINREQSLTGVPMVNAGVHAQPRDDDVQRLELVIRLRRDGGFLSRFMPPTLERKVKLDDLGTFVFGLIDGRRTVREIVEAFLARYRVNRREAELSTVEFIRSLAQRQAISIVIR
jgi:hypothetical protein